MSFLADTFLIDWAKLTPERVEPELREALANEPLGVAIAAPQLGASVRIFVVSGNALAKRAEKAPGTVPDTVFINPVFVKLSKKKNLILIYYMQIRHM